jgi:hypothetical protein
MSTEKKKYRDFDEAQDYLKKKNIMYHLTELVNRLCEDKPEEPFQVLGNELIKLAKRVTDEGNVNAKLDGIGSVAFIPKYLIHS